MPSYDLPVVNGQIQGAYDGSSTHGATVADGMAGVIGTRQGTAQGDGAQQRNGWFQAGEAAAAATGLCPAANIGAQVLDRALNSVPLIGGFLAPSPADFAKTNWFNQICPRGAQAAAPTSQTDVCSGAAASCIAAAVQPQFAGTNDLITNKQMCDLTGTNAAIAGVAGDVATVSSAVQSMSQYVVAIDAELDMLGWNCMFTYRFNPLFMVSMPGQDVGGGGPYLPLLDQLDAMTLDTRNAGESAYAWCVRLLPASFHPTDLGRGLVFGTVIPYRYSYDEYQVSWLYVGDTMAGDRSRLLPWSEWPFFWLNQGPTSQEAAELLAFDLSLCTASTEIAAELVAQMPTYGWSSRQESLFGVGTSPHGTGLRVGVMLSDAGLDFQRHWFYTDQLGHGKRSIVGDLLDVAESIPFIR